MRETLVDLSQRMIINLLLLHNVIIGKGVICVHYSRQGKVKGKDNKVLRATGNHTYLTITLRVTLVGDFENPFSPSLYIYYI